jgi:hypothetical protein
MQQLQNSGINKGSRECTGCQHPLGTLTGQGKHPGEKGKTLTTFLNSHSSSRPLQGKIKTPWQGKVK